MTPLTRTLPILPPNPHRLPAVILTPLALIGLKKQISQEAGKPTRASVLHSPSALDQLGHQTHSYLFQAVGRTRASEQTHSS
jgi:hypothetical protein